MAFDFDKAQDDIRKLRRFLKHSPKQATPKKVHSVRTTIRRFEAVMQALALDSKRNEQRLLKKLAKLRKRAGKVRDLDVLTGYVAGLEIKDEESCLVQLLEYLGSEHAHRNKQFHATAMKHGDSLRGRLKRTAGRVKALAKGGVAGNSAPGYTMLSELRLQRELTAPVRLTKNNLHPYRLKVKELRYMLEMENDPADRELIEILGRVKDAIGEWHDWQELLTIARGNLHHASKCKVTPVLQKTTQQKLKHALAVANVGRKRIRLPLDAGRDEA